MRIKILGSGGNLPTPRPFCTCEICASASIEGSKYKRNSSCAFIEEIDALIDVPEDIADSLTKNKIKNVRRLFITHWHPDHVFGLRVLLHSKYDFFKKESREKIDIYLGSVIYDKILKIYPSIRYHVEVLKTCNIYFIEDGKELLFENGIIIKALDYENGEKDHFAFLIKQANEQSDKSVLYLPCDSIDWKRNIPEVNILINECGINTPYETELSFKDLMLRLKKDHVKKTILTHIEEVDFSNFGLKKFDELKKENSDVNFEFAYDGQIIEL